LRRIQAVSEKIRARLDAENYLGEALPSIAKIRTALTRMLKVKNSLGLYKDFYRQNGKAHLLRSPAKNTMEWADVFPYLYLRAAYEGLKENEEIRHLLIDEMQDYSPVQFAVVNRIFKCPKTLLGDFGQSINPCHNHALHDLAALYPDAEMIELNKSYRSTYEIIHFARRFHKDGTIEAVKRHGEKPAILHCRDRGEELAVIRSKIAAFLAGANATLGIILKTDRDARSLYDSLSGVFNAHLISRDASEFRVGISISSVRMSKGLEFDEVLIPDVSAENYHSDFDQSLLYVACTRAMHKLTLTYSGLPAKCIANAEASGA
jgi:DNA helicase-2/ATP-dependent DNA helicase PcrA